MLTDTVLGARSGKWIDVGEGKSLASKRCSETTADSYGTAHSQCVSVIVWLLLGERWTEIGGQGRGREDRENRHGGE